MASDSDTSIDESLLTAKQQARYQKLKADKTAKRAARAAEAKIQSKSTKEQTKELINTLTKRAEKAERLSQELAKRYEKKADRVTELEAKVAWCEKLASEDEESYDITIYTIVNEAMRIIGICRALQISIIGPEHTVSSQMANTPTTNRNDNSLTSRLMAATGVLGEAVQLWTDDLAASFFSSTGYEKANFVNAMSYPPPELISGATRESFEDDLLSWVKKPWTADIEKEHFIKHTAEQYATRTTASPTISEAKLILAGVLDREMRKEMVAVGHLQSSDDEDMPTATETESVLGDQSSASDESETQSTGDEDYLPSRKTKQSYSTCSEQRTSKRPRTKVSYKV
jgi:hypothetical protein